MNQHSIHNQKAKLYKIMVFIDDPKLRVLLLTIYLLHALGMLTDILDDDAKDPNIYGKEQKTSDP